MGLNLIDSSTKLVFIPFLFDIFELLVVISAMVLPFMAQTICAPRPPKEVALASFVLSPSPA